MSKIKQIKEKLKQINKSLVDISEEVDNIKNENDIQELKKLFIDEITILEQKLSTKNASIFQKVIDEIKLLIGSFASNIENVDAKMDKINQSLKDENKKLKEHFDNFLKKYDDQQQIENNLELTKRDLEKSQKEIQNLNITIAGLRKKTEEIEKLKDDLSNLKIEKNEWELKAKLTIDEKEKLSKIVEKYEEEIQNLENDIADKEETIEILNKNNEEYQKQNSEYSSKIIDLNAQIENLSQELSTLTTQKDKLDQKVHNLEDLEDFKDVFMENKLMKLLESILNNPALVEFRKEKNITDKSATSIFNLVRLLYSPREFVKSYYDYVVEYKKSNQDKMSDEEVEFYKNINEYFDEEVIINPTKKEVSETKFDKASHRSIDLKFRDVELSDDKVILIPLDNVGHDKIKVKIK